MVKPLLYYCISTIVGCILSLLFLEGHYIGAAFIAASFLACIIFTINDKRFAIIILLFTLLSDVNYTIYFKHTGFIHDCIEVRVLEKEKDYYVSQYKGKLMILRGISKELNRGELIKVIGDFQSDTIFDKGIVGVYYVDGIVERKVDFIGKMYEFKRSIYSAYEKGLGSKKAAIISSVCFGDATYLKREDKDAFNKLGILHVISVSGLHLAIIYKLLEGFGGIKLALPLSLIYTIFTGAEAATLRAFIMIFILKMSKKVFKIYDPYSALAFSAMLLIFYRPYYITDIGFSLSFLSMLGIFLMFPKLKRKLIFLPNGVNDIVSLSLSAQFLSSLYVISMMNNFSGGFMLGNLFLMPMFSALVIVGNMSILFVKFNGIFNLFSWLLNWILTSIEGGSELLLKICPDITYVNYTWSIYIAIFYIAYLLFKSGKREYIYLPLIIFPLLFLDGYKIVPEIDYVKSGYYSCEVVRYKSYNILIADEKYKDIAKDRKINELNGINKVLICTNEDKNFSIDNYYITVLGSSSRKEFKDILVRNSTAGKLIIYKGDNEEGSIYENYDIITLECNSEDKSYGTISSIRILFGKFFIVT